MSPSRQARPRRFNDSPKGVLGGQARPEQGRTPRKSGFGGQVRIGRAESERLGKILDRFAGLKILVIADLVADEYIYGEISRVSREAPVVILRHRDERILPGGGANAVNNLADLGAKPLPVGVVGDDRPGQALLDYFRAKKIALSGVVRARGRRTTTKTRYLAGWTHTTAQQVLRMDREAGEPLELAIQRKVEAAARRFQRGAKAVLISDYGYGVASPEFVRAISAAVEKPIPIMLDARHGLLRYPRVTAATPNEPEIEELFATRIGTDTRKLEECGKEILRRMGLEALLVTRGKDGMVLFERDAKPQYIPIYGTDEIADVTGAGDTVIAVFTLALAAGAGFLDAARLANYAGGIVVMKRGTATVTRDELRAAIERS